MTSCHGGVTGAGGGPAWRASPGATQPGTAGTPSGAVTIRRGERACRHAAASSRSRVRPSRCPIASAVAITATGAARTANTGSGSTVRVASNPAQMTSTAMAVITTWRPVSPATSLSGSSTSAGTGTRWRAVSLT